MNKRIITIGILILLISILTSCHDTNRNHNEHILPEDAKIKVDFYNDASEESEYGFNYGDYVVKGTTYIGGIMNTYCDKLSNNTLAEGEVLHFYNEYIYEYTLFNEVLEKKDKVFAFSIVNNMEIEDLVTCIGVKEKNTKNTDIYDFLLLVDKKGNLYRAWCDIREEYTLDIFFIRWIELLEPVKGYVVGSVLIDNETCTKIDYVEFLDLIYLINKDVLVDVNSYMESEFYNKISSKISFSTSGLFHQWYRVGENYILNIYIDDIYDNVVCELIYYEEGIATFTCKDINKFKRFVNVEKCKKYFGTHYSSKEEVATIKMAEEGPYIEMTYKNKENHIVKTKGYCEINGDQLIVYETWLNNTVKKYFKILETEEGVVFKYFK